MNVAKPWCMVGLNPHHPDRETCSECWPYWGEYLVRTAPRVQCEELHAHHPHSWQFSGQPTNMCPGRATCDVSVTTIELRELPPLGHPVSTDSRAAQPDLTDDDFPLYAPRKDFQ